MSLPARASVRMSVALIQPGFWPFFLGDDLWAVAAIATRPSLLLGEVAIPAGFSPVNWRVHEMILG